MYLIIPSLLPLFVQFFCTAIPTSTSSMHNIDLHVQFYSTNDKKDHLLRNNNFEDIIKPILPLDAIKFHDNPPMGQFKHKRYPETGTLSRPVEEIDFLIGTPIYLVEVPPQMP